MKQAEGFTLTSSINKSIDVKQAEGFTLGQQLNLLLLFIIIIIIHTLLHVFVVIVLCSVCCVYASNNCTRPPAGSMASVHEFCDTWIAKVGQCHLQVLGHQQGSLFCDTAFCRLQARACQKFRSGGGWGGGMC